jgi:hypothetical protein
MQEIAGRGWKAMARVRYDDGERCYIAMVAAFGVVARGETVDAALLEAVRGVNAAAARCDVHGISDDELAERVDVMAVARESLRLPGVLLCAACAERHARAVRGAA